MTKKKDGASNGSTPETKEEKKPPEAAAADGANLPAKVDDYQAIFVPARNKMVSSLTDLAATLEGEPKQIVERLIKSANPKKKGREEMESRWIIPTVRIVHGVTKEKPDKAETGDLYTTSGFVLPQPLKVTPLYTYEQNRMFPDGGGKAPVCFAPDAKYGRPFGRCSECVNLPMTKNASRTPTDCDNGICFIVLSEDMKLYRIEFFKTSNRAGNKLDQLAAAGDNIWDRWFSVKTQLQSSSGNEWHIFRVSASGDDTPEWVRDAADILYDLIHAERTVFLKQHYQLAEAGDSAATNVKENVDLDAMGLSDDDSGDNPDLSEGGI